MKRIIIAVLLLLAVDCSYGQTQFKHKVWIKCIQLDSTKEFRDGEFEKVKYGLHKIIKVESFDSVKFDTGMDLEIKKVASLNKKEYTGTLKTKLSKETTVVGPKIKKTAVEYSPGKGMFKANLHASNDTIYVNFWLCKDYYSDKQVRKSCPYHPDTTYFYKLENRQYKSFWFTNGEVSALTVPFKIHFGYSKDSIDVDPQLLTDLNFGGYLGYRVGRVRYNYDKYKGMQENLFSGSIGTFAGLSSVKIDSNSTSLDDLPLKSEANVPVFSWGIGGVLNLKDFQLGLFWGYDFGIGNQGKKWNFDGRPWLGFGFGYNLALLGKKA